MKQKVFGAADIVGSRPAGDSSGSLPVVEPKHDHLSVFAFSLEKAGSTLLNDALRKLSPLVPTEFRSLEDELFARNVLFDQRAQYVHAGHFFDHGFCYGGFRRWPSYQIPGLERYRSILLIRDPRDIVVSMYFSQAKSHVVPSGDQETGVAQLLLTNRAKALGQSPDQYARDNIDMIELRYGSYIRNGAHLGPNVKIYRYEDVIYAKEEWFQSICDWFGWKIAPDAIHDVAKSLDVIPDSERQDQHVRQVHPGNHKQYLTPETIALYGARLGDHMRAYGYKDI
jgi:hypothetical protein